MKELTPTALFRLSVIGALVSRERLARGELKSELERLAARHSSPRLIPHPPVGQDHRRLATPIANMVSTDSSPNPARIAARVSCSFTRNRS
uniref:Uncharacterized protein n=1 Tax=Candidatus Kentrum sp. FM TaxID=2126340 RepID=A0A450T2X3_9GAMM|nr:MAG: hypothetical protein BECKFM1743A_GA0114220_102683 [Candidatus Kentron sp. FM]VFJ66822.1 MAG: hypothetical protein BECKFM1743C_GA0114222_104372 [Candidatus Kentron sp. FM]VFK09855.1 MAG: hypothetical protein BECKFM1743B_GA0114221_101186 [Candidatus Kentron sp. FM]